METFTALLKKVTSFLEKRDPLLFAVLIYVLYFIVLIAPIFISPVQAQIGEYHNVVSEFPLVKAKISTLKEDVENMREDQKIQGAMLRETQTDIKTILRRMK